MTLTELLFCTFVLSTLYFKLKEKCGLGEALLYSLIIQWLAVATVWVVWFAFVKLGIWSFTWQEVLRLWTNS